MRIAKYKNSAAENVDIKTQFSFSTVSTLIMFQLTLLLVAIVSFAACNPIDSSYLPPSQGDAAAIGNDAVVIVNSAVLANAPAIDSGAVAEARSVPKAKPIPIVKFATDNDGEGAYSYNYESANGIVAEEKGNARGDGSKAQGSYSFTLPDGQLVSVTYTADENGFVAQGSHIPTAGPIPEAILRSLEENAAAEARGIFDDGQYHGEGLEEAQYREQGADSGSVAIVSANTAAHSVSEGYKYK